MTTIDEIREKGITRIRDPQPPNKLISLDDYESKYGNIVIS